MIQKALNREIKVYERKTNKHFMYKKKMLLIGSQSWNQ